ncbi:MAG TPA: UDP-3-O-(3-hydroxymyristoyl)glucosamine N-acyltransferase [Gemmatimonadales bacterium]|nr:UDP-3-O-(3-hydroxymyristoyl)glucosamine N-acyltransferase [Gemmatimonadales bacterium]
MNSAGTRPLPASEIAALTGGRLVGPGTTTVAGIAPLERAGPGDLSFLASPRYAPYFQRTSASVVLVANGLEQTEGGPETRIIVPDPYAALLVVLPVLYPQAVWEAGVHPTAVVGRGATWQEPVEIGPHAVLGHGVQLGRNVRIGAGCVLGDGVAVGDDSQLYPGVTLYAGTALGKRVIVHAGAVIGSDGFGYIPGKGGESHRKIPHVGRCLIGDDIEIGANTCIDRGSVDDTVIGSGTKIDNLVHIAHNVRIGARCLIMAQAGIAGSCQVEDDVIIAGQAGVSDHITIGRGARLLVQSGTIADIPADATYFGTLARPHREYLRGEAALYRLAKIVGQLEDLVKKSAPPAPLAPLAPPATPAGPVSGAPDASSKQ